MAQESQIKDIGTQNWAQNKGKCAIYFHKDAQNQKYRNLVASFWAKNKLQDFYTLHLHVQKTKLFKTVAADL